MVAPAVAPTGAAQVAEPMIIIEPEKKSAEKRSHDNLDDTESDAAAKRGALAHATFLRTEPDCRGLTGFYSWSTKLGRP